MNRDVCFLSDPSIDGTIRIRRPKIEEESLPPKDLAGILLVSIRGTAYAEIEVPAKRVPFDLVLPAGRFFLRHDLVLKARITGQGLVLAMADPGGSFRFQKKVSETLRVYPGIFFSMMAGDGTMLECVYKKYGEEYAAFTSYAPSPGASLLTIGRGSDNMIQCCCRAYDERGKEIGDVVSRDVGQILLTDGRAMLEDHSRHGIYVNGRPVRLRQYLQENDRITFWNNCIIWHGNAFSIRNTTGGFMDMRYMTRL